MQLRAQQALRNALVEFEEQTIQFAPTYKYKIGLCVWVIGSVGDSTYRSFICGQVGHLLFSQISFLPGVPGEQFDIEKGSKGKPPSYCDRILFMSNPMTLRHTGYISLPQLCSSDHKPVRASFVAKVS